MKISSDQPYQSSLTALGAELVQMIKDQSYDLIADRFGYALAYGRPQAYAIASDIAQCLTADGRSASLDMAREARILVKRFEPNDANLSGLVECFLPLQHDNGELLAEIIVTKGPDGYYLMLEDVSYRFIP